MGYESAHHEAVRPLVVPFVYVRSRQGRLMGACCGMLDRSAIGPPVLVVLLYAG